MIVCHECGNKNPLLFFKKNNKHYCRQCLLLPKGKVDYDLRKDNQSTLALNFSLTKEQVEIAQKLVSLYQKGENCLLYAVCGAGKTEIVYPLIEQALNEGKRVGFAIPRKDVVIELWPRIQKAFPNNKVVALYGGHHDDLIGDITVLTMHQIGRYVNYFDLLIADEIDAFPFQDNELLERLFIRSAKGPIVMMSATPSERWQNFFKQSNILKLNKRFHGYPIPLPKMVVLPNFLKIFYLLKKLYRYQKEDKPCLIFVSSLARSESLAAFLHFFFPNGTYVHSKREDRDKVVKLFKTRKLSYLVTTSILERGITISSLQVIIYDADESIYNASVLEQISGRVGRKIEDPTGDVIFLASFKTKEMLKAYQIMKGHNESL